VAGASGISIFGAAYTTIVVSAPLPGDHVKRAGWWHQRRNIERLLLIAGEGIYKLLAHQIDDIWIVLVGGHAEPDAGMARTRLKPALGTSTF
jgi:hypothetical protein